MIGHRLGIQRFQQGALLNPSEIPENALLTEEGGAMLTEEGGTMLNEDED